MATDIYCPYTNCPHIRKSGLCDKSVIVLEGYEDGMCMCTDAPTQQPGEEVTSVDHR